MRPGTKENQRQSIEKQTIMDYIFRDPFWVFLTKFLRIFYMDPEVSKLELITNGILS